ncbi:aldo/keto reductase [Actinomadura keratinilytica]
MAAYGAPCGRGCPQATTNRGAASTLGDHGAEASGPHRPARVRIGLGTLTWGRGTDEHDAAELVKTFWEAGGSLVDTADVYADGEAEYLLGRIVDRLVPREDLVIATKAGSVPDPERRFDGSRGHLLGALDASLHRLGTDHVDLWQVHAFDPLTPLEETLQALDIAVTTGRARYAGVSNFSGWQLAKAATWQLALPSRAHQTGQHPDGVLAAPARRGAGGAARRPRPGRGAAALLAARQGRPHR